MEKSSGLHAWKLSKSRIVIEIRSQEAEFPDGTFEFCDGFEPRQPQGARKDHGDRHHDCSYIILFQLLLAVRGIDRRWLLKTATSLTKIGFWSCGGGS